MFGVGGRYEDLIGAVDPATAEVLFEGDSLAGTAVTCLCSNGDHFKGFYSIIQKNS